MLAAGAAHELASPLSTIAVASGELLRRFPAGQQPAQMHDDVVLIRSQVDRCREILDQLAIDAGQAGASSFGDIGWNAIVEQALRGLDPGRVQIEGPSGPAPSLKGSLVATSRALRNLVRNALDASAPGSAVRLVVAKEGDGLAFEVQDQGTGMVDSVLARAREPFFTTKPRGQGMGLGLFLAESVAEQMGGRLEIASASGGGTRAKLVFPLPPTMSRRGASLTSARTVAAHA
jgi:two-component system sensor histidine kinase RegB